MRLQRCKHPRADLCDTTGDVQAGILIYTAAADSDGTLGGLVDLGKPESLGHLLEQTESLESLLL